MRENRPSGLMRGGKQTVIGLVPLNPSLPAYSTIAELELWKSRCFLWWLRHGKERIKMLRIGIPVLNGGGLLIKLLRSIDVPAEVYIVVNCIGGIEPSVREALIEVKTTDFRALTVTVKRVPGNLGVAGSWNAIIDHFGGGCIIANNDITFRPNALEQIVSDLERRRECVLQHILASACFYVNERFTATLGWFDENFYPAYHEDQEMSIRAAALNVSRCNVSNGASNGVHHMGSRTLKTCDVAQRQLIRRAQRLTGIYLARRWGQFRGRRLEPNKEFPFDDPSFHASDWILDLQLWKRICTMCGLLTRSACPNVFHRSRGGLSA